MKPNEVKEFFAGLSPDVAQVDRMREEIASAEARGKATQRGRSGRRRWAWPAIPAACVVIGLLVALFLPFGGDRSAYAIQVRMGEEGAVFRLQNTGQDTADSGDSISLVNPRPGLEFYIEGENIARIELKAKNEYLYAVDWTRTQEEKYWNPALYQSFDEERQVSVADVSQLFDKSMTMNFAESFRDYDQIWYRWEAWNMYQWAAQDNYAHFLGAGQTATEPGSAEERELAAGEQSGIGHMQLDGYPKELCQDIITVVITDRQGKRTTHSIQVEVSNNELRQTVVKASLLN